MTQANYTLPPLPYASNALDGFLSSEILELHHDEHHASYVDGLNRTLEQLHEARKKNDFARIKSLNRSLAFFGSGHVLHSIYWLSMSPNGGSRPDGSLAEAIEADFGDYDAFCEQFAAAAREAEASGWGILAYEPLGDRLVVTAAEAHQQMAFQGAQPLLVCDVWEHAYYLRYENRRAEYVKGFFDVIDWRHAARRHEEARRQRLAVAGRS